jgi:hypothetical protein
MNTSRWLSISLCLVSLLFVSPGSASAQIYEQIGTRAQGMGGAFVAVADDATATWWNPAGLILTYFSAVVEHSQLEEPTNPLSTDRVSRLKPNGFAVSFPALGLSYYRLRISGIAPTSSTGAEEAVRQDLGATGGGVRSTVIQQWGVTVGQSVGNHLVLGSTVKLARAGTVSGPPGSLDDAESLEVPLESSGDLDVGALLRFGRARVGVSVKHLNEPKFGEGVGQFALTRQARAGVAWVAGAPNAPAMMTVAFDADLLNIPSSLGEVRHVATGVDLMLTKLKTSVRGGWNANTLGDLRPSGSAGVSATITKGIYFDAARTWGADESRSGWAVGFRLTI